MALLDNSPPPSPPGWAIASGAILAALMDKLVANRTISNAEAAGIISEARLSVDQFKTHIAHGDAVQFLDKLGESFRMF